jgi:hypothetical protein
VQIHSCGITRNAALPNHFAAVSVRILIPDRHEGRNPSGSGRDKPE